MTATSRSIAPGRAAAREDGVRERRVLPNGTEVELDVLPFAGPFPGHDDRPQFFHVFQPPHSVVEPHYHVHEEFQVVVGGGGTFGRHPVAPAMVHYSGAYTPYGPIVAGPEGVQYLTIRARHDPGAAFLPARRAEMRRVEPKFLMADGPRLSTPAELARRTAFAFEPVLAPDADGVAAWAMRLPPGGRAEGPDPAGGGGQYLVVAAGAMVEDDRLLRPWSAAFVAPGEPPRVAVAGDEGLELLVFQFPRGGAASRPEPAAPAAGVPGTTTGPWSCDLCGFAYVPALGLPEEGVPPGTAFADLPEDWTCPNCAAAKADFRPA